MPDRSTSYPCCISALGEFRRSWLHDPHAANVISCLIKIKIIPLPYRRLTRDNFQEAWPEAPYWIA